MLPKLPKQWLYWCRKAGLKPVHPRSSTSRHYLKMSRYIFTIDDHYGFAILNSQNHRYIAPRIPQTELEFITTIDVMIAGLRIESEDRSVSWTLIGMHQPLILHWSSRE